MSERRDASPPLEVLRWEHHRPMPWRNGGGITYEVASSPAGDRLTDFDWRISIAEVQAGGPFSAFPGIDRTIVLIDGEWMALTVDGERHRFGIGEPFRFDGGSETMCEVAGPSRDLNVMTRRGRATASVSIVDADSSPHGRVEATELVWVCLTPTVVLAADTGTEVELHPRDAVRSAGDAPLTIRGDGTVALIGLSPSH